MSSSTKKQDENPLINIAVNVILPVLALTHLSKDGGKFWHVGPTNAMIAALILPISYGIWHFAKTKKFNLFSMIGLISVLLTGGLTIYLWNADGSVKTNAAQLFGLKEGSIPLVLGITIVASHWTKSPLIGAFLYSDSLFDIRKIEKTVKEKNASPAYETLLFRSTLIFAGSFLISTVMNYFLALYFLDGVTEKEAYNAAVGKITGWGFAVIGVPIMVLLMATGWYLISGLKKITGLTTDELLQAR